MAEILSGSINKNLLTQDVWTKVTLKDGSVAEFLNFTVAINNAVDGYGQIGNMTLAQTKEERIAKSKKKYLANLKRIWSDAPAPKLEDSKQEDLSDLPF
jgi:hypothetical protein